MNLHKSKLLAFLLLFPWIISAQTPDWTVNPADYSNNGSITAVVILNTNEVTTGTLGAFVDGTCRGVADGVVFQPTGRTVFMLMCYSNSASGDTLTFKYYNPDDDKVYDISETVEFVSDMIVGSAPNPVEFHALVNHPPTVINPIPDQNFTRGFSSANIDITNVFNDPDGDNLTYSVNSSNESVITASISGTSLFLTEMGAGSSNITVTAKDADGDTISDAFVVNVYQLQVDPSSIVIPASGGQANINVTSNTSWTITGIPDWLSVDPSSGNASQSVSVTANQDNPDTTSRVVTLTISGGGLTKTVTITQEGAPMLIITPEALTLGYQAGAHGTFHITSANISSLSTSGIPSWLTVEPTSISGNSITNITVTTVSKNSSTTPRNAVLYFSGGGITRSVIVTQQGSPELSVNPSSLILAYEAGSNDAFQINAENTSWTITAIPDWLSVSSSSGNASQAITVTANTANPSTSPRSASLTISGGSITRAVTVTQEGAPPTLVAGTDTITLDAFSGSQSLLKITSNINWDISENSNWLTITPLSGSGNDSVMITAAENQTTSPRISIVTISGSNVDPIEVVVIQKGATPFLQVFDSNKNEIHNNDTLKVPYDSGSVNITVKTNADNWNFMDDALWLTSTRENDTLLNIIYTENNLCSQRNAAITINNTNGIEVKFIITEGIDTNACASSVNDNTFSRFSLYPNPSHDHVYLKTGCKQFDKLNIILIDNVGQIVLIKTYYDIQPNDLINLDIKYLQEGIYFIRIKNNKGSKMLKFIKD